MAENKKSNDVKLPIVKGKIANAITSAAKGHVVATTDDIYDTNFLEYQDKINKKVNRDINTINEKIDTIESDLWKIGNRVTTAEGKIVALENNVANISGSVINNKNNIQILSGTVNSIDNRLTEAESGIGNLEERATNTESRLNALDTNISVISGSIEEIKSKIPEEASSSNQLADKQFVIDLIHSTSSAFRGSWETWDVVPTDSDEYPEDGEGNRIPRQGDYIVIVDASEYVGEDTGKTYEGSWRFVYEGEWDDNNKNGWKPEYQIEAEITPITIDELDEILVPQCIPGNLMDC